MKFAKIFTGAVKCFRVLSKLVCDMPDRLARRVAEKKDAAKALVPFYVVPMGDTRSQSPREKLDRRMSRMEEDLTMVLYRMELERETMDGWLWWGKQELGQIGEKMEGLEKRLSEVWGGLQQVHGGACELSKEIAVVRNILAQQDAARRQLAGGSNVWGWSQGM